MLAADDYRRMTAAAAAGLLARGLRRGDRVAVVTPSTAFRPTMPRSSRLQVIAVVAAALRSGLVPVPINPLLTEAERAHIIEDSGAAAVLEAPTIWSP